MYKFLLLLPKRVQFGVIIGSTLLALLSICLLIAGVADDGVNQFAKTFSTIEKVQVDNPIWEQLDALAGTNQSQIQFINTAKAVIGQTYTDINYIQNTKALVWFVICMAFALVLFISIATSFTYVSLKTYKIATEAAYREGIFNSSQYAILSNVIDEAIADEIKKTKKEFGLLDAEIEKLEAETDEIGEQ